MPRAKKARRFDTRFPVSALTVEAETKALAREIEDYTLLSRSELEAKRSERHALTTQTWEHLVLLLGDCSEQEQAVLQALLFRDLYLVVELYRAHLRGRMPETVSSSPPSQSQSESALPFTDFLFDL